MTKEKFDNKIKEINDAKNKAIKQLKYKYAMSNNKYKVNDVIEDHIGKGKIEEITAISGAFGNYGECLYRCLELKKDGKPKKNKNVRQFYQSNLINAL